METKEFEQALLRSLEAISANLQAQAEQMSKIDVKLDNTHERVIRLESQKHEREIGRVEAAVVEAKGRIAVLELANANRVGEMRGAGTVAEYVHKFAPWLIAGYVMFSTYVLNNG